MNISNINSIQRVVNFTMDDGNMLQVEHSGTILPGVTMICDLPLLFTNGLPTCLEDLTISQLEKFVPYLIKCAGGSSRTRPVWWPHELYFSTSLEKISDMSEGQWLSYLKQLVSSCYTYHGCEYVLRLCANPSHKCRSKNRTSVSGLDVTMTLKNKITRRKSATIMAANMSFCGKEPKLAISPSRKSLNDSSAMTKTNSESTRKKNPPLQICICDTCDAEFSSFKETLLHEKVCVQKCSASAALRHLHPEHSINLLNTSVPPHDCGPNTESTSIHTAPTRTSRIGCSSAVTLTQEPRLLSTSRRRAGDQTTVPAVSPLKDGYLHNSREEIESIKNVQHRKTLCQKKKLLRSLPLQYLPLTISSHTSNNTINNEQVSSRDVLPNNKSLEGPKKNSPVRKRKMSLMPRIQDQSKKLKQPCDNTVFLCDNCDKEFETLTDIRQHETLCHRERIEMTPSPVISTGENELQDNFLNYFRLASPFQLSSVTAADSSQPRRKKCSWNSLRYTGIPISSSLGSQIHSRSRMSSAAIFNKIEKIERFCSRKPAEVADDWRVSWKLSKTNLENSTHEYIFPIQRWWRMPILWKSQMEIQTKNRVLLSICKPLQIKIRRLTAQEIEFHTTCRTLRPKLQKMTREEIHLYMNKFSVLPKIRLSSQEIKAYTTPIAPNIRRLSFQELKNHITSETSFDRPITYKTKNKDNSG